MNKLSSEEVESLYRCISMAMDWRDAFDEELVEEMYWLAHNSNVFDEFGKKINQKY